MILLDLFLAFLLLKVIYSKKKQKQEWEAYQRWLVKRNKENENEM